jgi:RNA methyltransferase, TrmH family
MEVWAMALSKSKAKLLERLRNPRQRPREGAFLVEGARSAREFLRASLPLEIRLGLVSPSLAGSPEGREVLDALAGARFTVEELPDRELEAVSDVQRPQGVILVVSEPQGVLQQVRAGPGTRILILDGVQDPGNAGTLIRAARAFGLDGVVALDGTVDHWNPKVVRSSAGSLAHIPVARLPWSEASRWLREQGVALFVADPAGEDVRGFRPSAPWALAVGNEGGGPRREVVGEARRVLAIPMAPEVDSLNAGMAGSILLFTLSGHPVALAGGEEAEGR